MNALYFMDELPQLVLLFFICLLLIAQVHIFCLTLDVHRPHRKLVISQEVLILSFVLVTCIAMSAPIISLHHGDLAIGRYDLFRYGLGLLAFSSAFWGIQTPLTKWLLTGAVLVALPWADDRLPALGAALLLWFIRDYLVIEHIRQLRQEQITAGAIKEAMDDLPIGMIFAYENGEIFLTNVAALRYMYGCFRQYFGDIAELWEASVAYPEHKCQAKKILGRDLFLRLTPSCSLLLSLQTLDTPKKKIRQLLIKNVTEEDHDNLQLRKQNAALAASGNELKNMLHNLEAVTRQQVATKLRFYMHDLVGQRLTLLQQLLYEGQPLDYRKFLAVLEEVSGDLRKIEVQSPEDKLANILTTYTNIGIQVQINGTLPRNKAAAETYVAIIREGITNGVRHGHCDKVKIQLQVKNGLASLDISDNGIGCPKTLTFGTGLTGIADRLHKINGILSISKEPIFNIHCEVKDNCDQDPDRG